MSKSAIPMVAIVGQPNVGKSSLFNRLSGRREAIVAKEEGTTRDPVQRLVKMRGRLFYLVDTAGLFAETPDDTAQQAAEHVDEAITNADLVLAVFDATRPLSSLDRQVLKRLYRSQKPILAVVSKVDQTKMAVPVEFTKLGKLTVVGVSNTTGVGVADLSSQLVKRLPRVAELPILGDSITIVGRPNVGKSSLFNKLTGQSKAIVSAEAHTTRDANWATTEFDGHSYQLFDTAGVRKAGKRHGLETFSYLRTLRAINESEVSILVIDATEPSVKVDQVIAGLVRDSGKGLILAINKWDQVEDKATQRTLIEQKLQNDFAFVWWAPVVFMSAQTGLNVQKLLELADHINKVRRQERTTDELAPILAAATAHHPPALDNNRRPQLRSLEQLGTEPPQFLIRGSRLDSLHWSYKRFLEAQLRQGLDLMGTPITLDFETKAKPS